MSRTIRIFVAVFLLGVPWILNAQLRRDLLESARNEKEAALTPETPPKAERGIVRAQDSLAYRLLTGEARGFGVAFGQIAPGSGFSVGPKYKRTDLLSGRLTFSVEARATTTESYLGRMELSLPHLLDDRGSLDFTVQHRNISEMSYYGPGPDSEKTGRSNYRLEDTNLELRPAYRPFQKLRVGMIGSYLAVNVGQGHADRYISAERQYTPEQAPGIDRQTNFWRGGGFVEFDWRDRPHNPRSGGKYSAQYTRFLDRDLGSSSFFRLDLDAAQYIPLVNLTKVIVLHGSTSLTEAGSGQRVPFYLQPTLGGSDTLRGYRPYRFYGDNSVLVNAEYRWDLSPILQAVAFADGGKVFNRWEQWNLHALESDVGFGIRVRGRSAVVFSFDTGFSHEGFQLWFRVNNMF